MEYNILRDWLSNHQFTWEKLGDILTYHHNAPILFSSGLFFFLFIGFLMIYMSAKETYVGSYYLCDIVFPLFLL